MYKDAVIGYPGNYCRTNISKIVENIDDSRSLTVFAPSGYGKSVLARYLVYNKRYRRNYRELRNVHLIYVNLKELSGEAIEEQSIHNSQPETNKHKKFIEILARSLLNSETNLSPSETQEKLQSVINSHDYKNAFYNLLNKIREKYKDKKLLFILDDLESIIGKNYDAQREFLSNLRVQHHKDIEYIFFLGNLAYLDNMNREQWGSLGSILSYKIVLLGMPINSESILPSDFNLKSTLWFNQVTKRSQSYRNTMEILDIGKGYPPYSKYLRHLKSKDELKHALTSRELYSASERLFNSLNKDHMSVLRDFATGNKINIEQREVKELFNFGILRLDNNVIKYFSPIFGYFLSKKFD